MTLGQQIALGFQTWELWLIAGMWMLIPTVIYCAKRSDEKIARLEKEVDEALLKWIKDMK